MKYKYVFILFLSLHSFASFSQTLPKSRNNNFGIGMLASNGFYNIKEIKYGGYKSEGTQFSYGLRTYYMPTNDFSLKLDFIYTHDNFKFQNYAKEVVFFEAPITNKEMGYLDFSLSITYNLLNKKKFKIYGIVGSSLGILIQGKQDAMGIYTQNYPPYYFGGSQKQFNNKVFSSILGFGTSYNVTKNFSVNIESISRYYLNEIAINEDNNISFLNIIIATNVEF